MKHILAAAPSSKLVFVMNHNGGDSTVIDPVKHGAVGRSGGAASSSFAHRRD